MAGESKNWIKGAIKHPGAFSAKAKKAKMSTSAFAKKVKAAPNKFSTTTRKQANLATTLSKLRGKKK
jgi:hypothetical protein